MKEYVVIILWTILHCAHLDTHGQPRSAKEAKSVAAQMNEHLDLTPEQYRRVVEINKTAARKMAVAIEESDSESAVRESKMIILDEMDLALMEILSSRQWHEWTNLSRNLFETQSGIKKDERDVEYFSN